MLFLWVLTLTFSLTNNLVISTPACSGAQIHITESNWTVILEGEWMVKFYAPWCPACNAIQGTWKSLASTSHLRGFCVASADVTQNAGLSGRFFITSLPTIYHVKDGQFRLYSKDRSEKRMSEFAGPNGAWKDAEAVPWYSSPTSILMSILGFFFRFSALLKDTHTHMTEDMKMPSWLAYLFFAVVTILTGLLFGLCIVFMCDFSSDRGHVKRQAQHKKDDDQFKNMDVIEEQFTNSASEQEDDEEEDEEEGEEEREDGGGDKKDN